MLDGCRGCKATILNVQKGRTLYSPLRTEAQALQILDLLATISASPGFKAFWDSSLRLLGVLEVILSSRKTALPWRNKLPVLSSLHHCVLANRPFSLFHFHIGCFGASFNWVEFFLAPFFFFFWCPFLFFFGWLVSARTVPLLQAVAGKSWNFCRVQGFATQHSFWGLGFCNPTLLLGLKVLQPNIPFRASGFCNSTFLLGLRVLQLNIPFRAQGCCKPTLLLGLKVLQPNTPFRA